MVQNKNGKKYPFTPTDHSKGILTFECKLGFANLLNPSSYESTKDPYYSAQLLFEKNNPLHKKALEHISAYARYVFEIEAGSKQKAKEMEAVALNPGNIYSLVQDCDKKPANQTATQHKEKLEKYEFYQGCYRMTPKSKQEFKPYIVNASNEPVLTKDWVSPTQKVRADIKIWVSGSYYGCNLKGVQVLANKPMERQQESRFDAVEIDEEDTVF